jgi:hypothetical protein
MFSRKVTRSIAIGAVAAVLGAGTYGIVSATANTGSGTPTASPPGAISAQRIPRGGESNARSRPAAGGSSGTVESVSNTSFTVLTGAGQTVTVKKAPSTTYRKGRSSSSATAVRRGVSVLVLGTARGTTITASKVVVQPAGGTGSRTPSSAGVVPFQRGAQSTSKQVGQIPANYSQGSGTIVAGAAANKATEAALAAFPGGVVDRVVKLSNGAYEVHNIGVNWPHHIFVSQNFKLLGAD